MHADLRILTLLAAAAVAAPQREGVPAPPPPPEVVVDYSVRHASYRVVGDATLLSQRYTPGTTVDLLIAAAALESGAISSATEISVRGESLSLPRALKESNDDFFAQLLKRTGYEPVREFLLRSRYTPGIPDAVASFADLARGEPLRVTVFEQNLFLQAFVARRSPLPAEHCASLERWLAVDAPRPSWGTAGWGEISPEGPRYVSWFNGAARLKDGQHVITVVVLGSAPGTAALERFRDYVGGRR